MIIIHLDQMLESKGQVSLSVQFTEQERRNSIFSPKLKCFYNKELF